MIGNSELQKRMAEQIEFALSQTPEALAAENAKLRELVGDMWRGSVTRMDFADRHVFIGEFVDRMRELGVDA